MIAVSKQFIGQLSPGPDNVRTKLSAAFAWARLDASAGPRPGQTGSEAKYGGDYVSATKSQPDDSRDHVRVHLKISGIGEPGVRWSVERNGPIVRDALAIFGVERCMFASNFLVDSVVVSLGALFSGFKQMVAARAARALSRQRGCALSSVSL